MVHLDTCIAQYAAAEAFIKCAQSNDVVAGLADLFRTFDAQERQSGEQQESTARQIVAPTKLRDALHALDPHRFSTGMHCPCKPCLRWCVVAEQWKPQRAVSLLDL